MADPEAMQESSKKPGLSKRIKGGGVILALIVVIIVVAIVISVATKHKKSSNAGGFNRDFSITWAQNHTKVSNHGKRLELILDQESGMQFIQTSGFSKLTVPLDSALAAKYIDRAL